MELADDTSASAPCASAAAPSQPSTDAAAAAAAASAASAAAAAAQSTTNDPVEDRDATNSTEDSDDVAVVPNLANNAPRRLDVILGGFASRLQSKMSTMSVIDNTVRLGNARASRDLEQLLADDVKVVINATKLEPHKYEDRFKYHRIAVDDLETESLAEHFGVVFDIIERCREQGQRVLVHCQAGVSRSASLVIAYVMRANDIPLAAAYERVKQARPIIAPNAGFWRQLIAYEQSLRDTASVQMVATAFGIRADVSMRKYQTNAPASQAPATVPETINR